MSATDQRTREQLLTECYHLTHMNGNLAAENARLRVQAALAKSLEATVAELRQELTDAAEDLGTYATEVLELEERIEELESYSDPDAISESVHDFLRMEHLLPERLDAPLILAPHTYVIGLYEAVQKVVSS